MVNRSYMQVLKVQMGFLNHFPFFFQEFKMQSTLLTFSFLGFQAEIGRYSTSEREWEIYRFLLDENCKFQLSSMVAREQIVDRVRRALMGW